MSITWIVLCYDQWEGVKDALLQGSYDWIGEVIGWSHLCSCKSNTSQWQPAPIGGGKRWEGHRICTDKVGNNVYTGPLSSRSLRPRSWTTIPTQLVQLVDLCNVDNSDSDGSIYTEGYECVPIEERKSTERNSVQKSTQMQGKRHNSCWSK